MDSYKDLYMHMMHETERAMRIIVEAKQACEEAFLNHEEAALLVFPCGTDMIPDQED